MSEGRLEKHVSWYERNKAIKWKLGKEFQADAKGIAPIVRSSCNESRAAGQPPTRWYFLAYCAVSAAALDCRQETADILANQTSANATKYS